MKGLKTLVRVHKSKLEAERRKLAELESVAAGFAGRIDTLQESAEREGRAAAAAPDAAHAMGSFVQGLTARVRTLRASLADVEREMGIVRERIQSAFQELKRYEIAEERRQARARFAAGRRARIAEDELGLSIHRRRDTAQAG